MDRWLNERWRPVVPIAMTLAMAAALLLIFAASRTWQRSALADHLHSELGDADTDQIALLVRQLGELGDEGIPPLVRALGSPRPTVAERARRELLQLLEIWDALEPAESSPKLAVLAASLAEEVGEFDPSARRVAAELAHRLLLRPTDGDVIERDTLIASCEAVLKAVPAADATAEGTLALRPPLGRSGTLPTGAGNRPGDRGPTDVAALAVLPGGNLPVVPSEIPGDIRAGDAVGGRPVIVYARRPGEPRRLPEDPHADLPTEPRRLPAHRASTERSRW
ncbi:MAG: hypothetical protein WD468_05585 [Pirellulales bacterium]